MQSLEESTSMLKAFNHEDLSTKNKVLEDKMAKLQESLGLA